MKSVVVVVGSYVQDLTWRCGAFPTRGETVVGEFATGPGGKGSNQAVAAGRAGAATCFIGAVGDDAFAIGGRAFYRREKIAARFSRKSGFPTGTAAILVNSTGENEIIVALGANAVLSRRDIDREIIRNAGVLVTQLESNLATTEYVLRLARRAGVPTILNPAPMRADFDPAILRDVDILIPNEPEFLRLINRRRRSRVTEAALRRIASDRLQQLCRATGVLDTVIITLGERGCFVSQKDRYDMIAGHTGVNVVDTTGAGDAFVGAFAAGLLRFDGDHLRAAHFANAAAALSVSKHGTAPSMPRRTEIEKFLRRL
jgi:ribokinase